MLAKYHHNPPCHRGIYLIWIFVLIPILLGFLAFSVDMGLFLNEKGKAQTAADAAALAGVYTVRRLFDAEEVIGDRFGASAQAAVLDAARRAAADNGFTHDPPGVIVDVVYPVPDSANPPSPYPLPSEQAETLENKTAAYVRVTITQTTNSVFAPILGIDEGITSATALGRYKEQKPKSCPGIFIYPDDPRRPQQLDLKQASKLSVSEGGIYIDSDHANALAGSAGSTVTADWIDSSGGTGNAQIVYICRDNPTPCPDLYKDLDANFTAPNPTIPVTTDYPACTAGASTPDTCGTLDGAGNPICPCTLSDPCSPLAAGGCRVFTNTPVVGPDDLTAAGLNRFTDYCKLTAGKYCGGLTIRNDNSGDPFKVKLQPYVSGGVVADEDKDAFFYILNGVLEVDKSTVVADDGGVTGQGITIYVPDEGSGSTFSVDLDYSTLSSWENDTDCDAGDPPPTPNGSMRIWVGRLGLAHASCLNLHSYESAACGSPLEIYTGLVP